MEFKTRSYVIEERYHAFARICSDLDPLTSNFPPYQLRQVDDGVKNRNKEFFDPLRTPDSNALSEVIDGPDFESNDSGNNNFVEAQSKEWTSFKRFLMQRFPVSKMISLSSMSNVIVRSGKAHEKSSTSMHLEELDIPHKYSEEDAKVITRQEYISRLHDLKDEINHSWHVEDRVTSLKLSIKVARLLMDTSVSNVYSTLFVLATDVLDMLGDMVWERIRKKAEFAEDGTLVCSLPESFGASDVCIDAKETCYNWFCRVGSIHELLPRIYLELAILPCWRFLTDQPNGPLLRLVKMTRGLADPLASAYCRLYIAHRAQKLPLNDTEHLITCINDIKLVFTRTPSMKRSIIGQLEPAVEFIVKCIFSDASPRHIPKILIELGLGKSQEELFVSSPCVSIVLHHLLKELPTDIVSCHALDILHLIKCCNDYSYQQSLNYRLFGLRLCEQTTHIGTVDAVVYEVLQVVSQYGLDDYLKVVNSFVDIVLQNQMDGYLKAILEKIFELASNKVIAEDEQGGLQSILLKLLSHYKEDVFSLNHFLQILDLMQGSFHSIVNMHILDMATRNGFVRDPTIIQLLFEFSQALHDDTDLVNMKNDKQQKARVVTHFVRMVDYGSEYERHLSFLVQCRGAFGSITELKEILVHFSNCLVIKALKDGKKNLGFLRSCIAFSEVTIPSILDHFKQFNLYLETAEVALMGGLFSHPDGLIYSAINCLKNFEGMEGPQIAVDSDGLLSSVRKLCSLLVMIPGNPEVGILHIPESIRSLINSQSWSPRFRARMFCAIVSLLAALYQGRLPYHAAHPEILGNDTLFYGDSSYAHELLSMTESVLQNLVDIIEQEPSQAARGSLSLEACNCIVSSFKINEHVLPVCSKLIETAKLCLSPSDKHLKSTISFLDKNLPPTVAISPSIAI